MANGSDLPPEIVLQGFVKVEEGRGHLLLRVPLALLDNLSLPKRGPGYLDLTNIDPKLKQAAASFSRQIELSAEGASLAPTIRELRLSLLSDRSFASYSTALSHLREPPLPVETNLFWNQGFFDAHLEYSLQAAPRDIWIRVRLGPDLGARVKLRLEYLPAGESPRSYDIPGESGWIPLDPRWYDAAWLSAKGGFAGAFAIDRFVFLLCLVAPFRKFRGVLALVGVLAAMQALTLSAAAGGMLADVEIGWLPPLSATGLAAAMVLLAIANLAAPALRRRFFIAATVGALGGFGVSRLLTYTWQFAGSYPLVAAASFNLGMALGIVVSAALAVYALRLLFASVLGPVLGVVVLSALAGHWGWHWMVDGGRDLGLQLGRMPPPNLWPALGTAAPWLAPALVIGVLTLFLPRRFDGARVATLRDALQGRVADENPARPQPR